MKNNKINVREMLANTKINTLWCGYRLSVYNDKLKPFFDMIEKNNDLLQIFKSSERFCSLEGSSYIFFDIIDNIVKIGVYKPDVVNQTLKIDGIKEYAGVGVRQITATKSGTVVQVKECRTANQTQTIAYSGLSGIQGKIPVDVFTIELPEFVSEFAKMRTVQHNYGVLSMKQILNKNIIDLEFNEGVLPDNYSVSHLEPIINETLNYIREEQEFNKTRAFGSFSNQDISNYGKQPAILQNLIDLQAGGLIDNTLVDDYYDRFYNPNKKLATSRYFINTQGSNNDVKIQQGNLDLKALVDGLNLLIEVYYNGAGMSYQISTNNSGGVKSIEEVKTQSKTTYETIKMTNTLRKQQIEEFLERIMKAYGLEPNEYKGQWSFDVISNILDEDATSTQTIIDLYSANLLSQNEAVKRANPSMKEVDIDKMLVDINKKQENNDIIIKENNKER